MRTFLEELRDRRVLRAAAVYLVLAWGAVEVGATVLPLAGAPDWAPRLVLAIAAAGFPIALVLAWLYDLRAPGSGGPASGDRRVALGQALVIAAAAVVGLTIPLFMFLDRDPGPGGADADAIVRRPPASRERTVAMLPFRSAAEDGADEYFSAGIVDEVVTALTSFEGLRVLSREAAARLMDGGALPQDVGHRLGAGYLLGGSVRRAGPRVRISASLTRTETGEVAWSEDFDRELTVDNLFQVQEEVAHAVASALNARLAPNPVGRTRPAAHAGYRGLRPLPPRDV